MGQQWLHLIGWFLFRTNFTTRTAVIATFDFVRTIPCFSMLNSLSFCIHVTPLKPPVYLWRKVMGVKSKAQIKNTPLLSGIVCRWEASNILILTAITKIKSGSQSVALLLCHLCAHDPLRNWQSHEWLAYNSAHIWLTFNWVYQGIKSSPC